MALGVNLDYTYPGKLSTEVFLNPALQSPEIQSLFDVRSDVRNKEQINIAGPFDRFVLADDGNCNQSPQPDKVNLLIVTGKQGLEKPQLRVYLDMYKKNLHLVP